jgi:hypothetical protein
MRVDVGMGGGLKKYRLIKAVCLTVFPTLLQSHLFIKHCQWFDTT